MLPRDAAATAVRRIDYRPPAYMVDTVELTFALDPTSTLVTASLAFRRNPAAPFHVSGLRCDHQVLQSGEWNRRY